jgi:hypothetical protein
VAFEFIQFLLNRHYSPAIREMIFLGDPLQIHDIMPTTQDRTTLILHTLQTPCEQSQDRRRFLQLICSFISHPLQVQTILTTCHSCLLAPAHLISTPIELLPPSVSLYLSGLLNASLGSSLIDSKCSPYGSRSTADTQP